MVDIYFLEIKHLFTKLIYLQNHRVLSRYTATSFVKVGDKGSLSHREHKKVALSISREPYLDTGNLNKKNQEYVKTSTTKVPSLDLLPFFHSKQTDEVSYYSINPVKDVF